MGDPISKRQAICHAQFLRRYLLRQGIEQATTEDDIGLFDAAVFLESLPSETREQRTLQPVTDPKLTLDVALKEAERCRRYPDPVLNEAVIVVLADEVLRLRRKS